MIEISVTQQLVGAAAALIAGGWTMLKVSLVQFEKRLDEKFKVLDTAVGDVKRLELELLRLDTRNAQVYITRAEHDKVLERIFSLLERLDKKLDGKASIDDLHIKLRNP